MAIFCNAIRGLRRPRPRQAHSEAYAARPIDPRSAECKGAGGELGNGERGRGTADIDVSVDARKITPTLDTKLSSWPAEQGWQHSHMHSY